MEFDSQSAWHQNVAGSLFSGVLLFSPQQGYGATEDCALCEGAYCEKLMTNVNYGITIEVEYIGGELSVIAWQDQ